MIKEINKKYFKMISLVFECKESRAQYILHFNLNFELNAVNFTNLMFIKM